MHEPRGYRPSTALVWWMQTGDSQRFTKPTSWASTHRPGRLNKKDKWLNKNVHYKPQSSLKLFLRRNDGNQAKSKKQKTPNNINYQLTSGSLAQGVEETAGQIRLVVDKVYEPIKIVHSCEKMVSAVFDDGNIVLSCMHRPHTLTPRYLSCVHCWRHDLGDVAQSWKGWKVRLTHFPMK